MAVVKAMGQVPVSVIQNQIQITMTTVNPFTRKRREETFGSREADLEIHQAQNGHPLDKIAGEEQVECNVSKLKEIDTNFS